MSPDPTPRGPRIILDRRLVAVGQRQVRISETPFVPTVRHATREDAAFLQEMLAIAADWRPGTPVRSVAEVMLEPALAHYVIGWPRLGDVGFIAEAEHCLGAAWWRFFSAHDPGYGFIDEATPEVSVGVRAEARGRGIGTLVLEALVREARRRCLPALSLSVEPDNPAVALYTRLGFSAVADPGDAITMALQLV